MEVNLLFLLDQEKWEFMTSNCRELGQIFSLSVECTGIPQYVQFHCSVMEDDLRSASSRCVQLQVVRGPLYTHTSHEYALYRTTT